MYVYMNMCVLCVCVARLARPQGMLCAQTGAPSAYVALAGVDDERWRLRFRRCTQKLPLASAAPLEPQRGRCCGENSFDRVECTKNAAGALGALRGHAARVLKQRIAQ